MKINPTQMAGESRDGEFKPIPDGRYVAKVESFERMVSKAGNEVIRFQTVILGPRHAKRKIWTSAVLTEAALWKFAQFAIACGVKDEFDAAEDGPIRRLFLGKVFAANVGSKTYQGKVDNEFKEFYPLTESEAQEYGQGHSTESERRAPDPTEAAAPAWDDDDIPF